MVITNNNTLYNFDKTVNKSSHALLLNIIFNYTQRFEKKNTWNHLGDNIIIMYNF